MVYPNFRSVQHARQANISNLRVKRQLTSALFAAKESITAQREAKAKALARIVHQEGIWIRLELIAPSSALPAARGVTLLPRQVQPQTSAPRVSKENTIRTRVAQR